MLKLFCHKIKKPEVPEDEGRAEAYQKSEKSEKCQQLLSKKCLNRKMLSDFMLRSPFASLLLGLSVMLNKTVNFFGVCSSAVFLGHDYVPVPRRDVKK